MEKGYKALYILLGFATLKMIADWAIYPEIIVPSITILICTSIGFAFGRLTK
jgi:hypothetical protein